MIPFEKKFGIRVNYWGSRGSGVSPRIGAEQRAGSFLWDVCICGTTTGLTALVPMNALAPLEPVLILPEVKDPKQWRGGGMEFVDPKRQIHVMTLSQHPTLFINTKMIKPGDIKSHRDLLDPKWKGKIVADDPRTPGPGQATFSFFYMHPDLGPDYIRALLRQDILIIKNYRQEIDFLAQGKYPILIGTSGSTLEARMKQGLPIGIVEPHQLTEGSDVSPESGAVTLFKNYPHPNAVKIYMNWLLSREGQLSFARATGYISSRLDVPTDHAPARVPIPGSVKTYDQAAIDRRPEILLFLRKVIRK